MTDQAGLPDTGPFPRDVCGTVSPDRPKICVLRWSEA